MIAQFPTSNTFDLELSYNGTPVKVSLRLTIRQLLELKKNLNKRGAGIEDYYDIVVNSITDPEVAIEYLGAALNYAGNNNSITDGAELYDLLVDNGYAGPEAFVPVYAGVAVASGILSQRKADYLIELARREGADVPEEVGTVEKETEAASVDDDPDWVVPDEDATKNA